VILLCVFYAIIVHKINTFPFYLIIRINSIIFVGM
jgi:hypothetical protein